MAEVEEEMSLKERRKRSRDEALRDVLEQSALVRKIVASGANNPNEVSRSMAFLLQSAQKAFLYSQLVEDLDDVERYGPGGGR